MSIWSRAITAALAVNNLWAEPQGWISKLGTSSASILPQYLTNNPLPQGFPWGTRSAQFSNQYKDTPNTGVTRHYEWTISRGKCAPDGFENTCLFVNDQFPGPLVEANWGDWIELTVTNDIPDEGTSIHFHGLLQKATPYMDGVPGVTQCPIAPNETFTYRFQADLYGTSWYHAHWSAQYASGLHGPVVIYGPKDVMYDDDLGPVMISDYFHGYYVEQVEKTLANPASGLASPPSANNNLINGKTNNGGPGMAQFHVTSGKTYRIRLINTGAASVQKFTIDGYNFTIFANDFVPIVPYVTDVVTLAVGQRTDILFTASGKPTDSIWMRGYRPPPCGPSAGNEQVLAAICYEDADTSKPPFTQPGPDAFNQYCGNDALTRTTPLYSMSPPEPDVVQTMALNFTSNGTALLWYMNGKTFRVDYKDPMLLEAKVGNAGDFPPIRNAYIYPESVSSVRMIIENPVGQPHPMHLHGHNIWILQEGPCTTFDGSNGTISSAAGPNSSTKTTQGPDVRSTTVLSDHATPATENPTLSPIDSQTHVDSNKKRDGSSANSCWDGTIVNQNVNPQRRDVHMLQAFSYIVIQWVSDNPGVWPLHCHIAWHLSAGMSWMVVEHPEAIESEMDIPSIMAQTCRGWSAYSGDHVVGQIDDGI